MNIVKCGLACLVATTLVGCDSVLTLDPVTLDVDPPLQEDLVGKWAGEDSILELSFSEDGKGMVTIADDGDVEKADLLALRRGERIYCSLLSHDSDDDEKFWLFGVCQFKNPNELNFYFPRSEELEKQIGSGKLDGEIEKGKHASKFRISDTPKLIELIESDPGKYLEAAEGGLKRVR